MVALPVRYVAYLGGLVALLMARRHRVPAAGPAPTAGLAKLLQSARALQAGLRAAVLELPGGELAWLHLAESFLLEHGSCAAPEGTRDPRARHYVAKLAEALDRAAEQGAACPLELLRLAHEAALDLIDFLQSELGTGSRLPVGELRIDGS